MKSKNKISHLQWIISIAFLLTTLSAAHSESPAEYEERFADEERAMVECNFALDRARAVAFLPRGKSDKENRVYDIVRQQVYVAGCPQYTPYLHPQAPSAQMAGPLYSQLPQEIRAISCQWNEGDAYNTCEQAREQFLRPLFVGRSTDCPSSKLSTTSIYDAVGWHNYLLTNGYECASEDFKSRAIEMNQDQLAQQKFEVAVASPSVEVNLRGLNIAYIPPLAYERTDLRTKIPYKWFFKDAGERLTVQDFKRRMESLGANVKVIHRLSTGPLERQIEQSLRQLKEFDEETKDSGGFVAVTRSMGAMVMTAIMLDHAAELPNLKKIVHVGGTTYGSVIAEYKSRFDHFLQATIKPNIGAVPLIEWIDIFDDLDPRINNHIDDFFIAGFFRGNTATMSFKNPLVQDRKQQIIPVPIVNVILLPPKEENRVISTDPVFQNMAAYGPTEGSGRFVDVISQGSSTTNLVYSDLGHLAFRNLTKDQAIHLYQSIFATVGR